MRATDPAEVERIIAYRRAGVPVAVVAQHIGKSYYATRAFIDYHKLTHLAPASASPSFWTDDKFDRLKRLVPDGLSASQIALDLGCTRNAVIGKLRRAGLRLTGSKSPRPITAGPRRQRPRAHPKPGGMAFKLSVPGTATPPSSTDLPVEPPTSTWVRFADLGPIKSRTHCRWPVAGEPGPDMLCCGAVRIDDDHSYCAFHHARATAG
jgi:GcrA cell cycle regulator